LRSDNAWLLYEPVLHLLDLASFASLILRFYLRKEAKFASQKKLSLL
jgi:hypothetical protein